MSCVKQALFNLTKGLSNGFLKILNLPFHCECHMLGTLISVCNPFEHFGQDVVLHLSTCWFLFLWAGPFKAWSEINPSLFGKDFIMFAASIAIEETSPLSLASETYTEVCNSHSSPS